MSYVYPCDKGRGCKHFVIEYDVFTAFEGDTHVSNGQWKCRKHDDEMCRPDCTNYEQKEGGEWTTQR